MFFKKKKKEITTPKREYLQEYNGIRCGDIVRVTSDDHSIFRSNDLIRVDSIIKNDHNIYIESGAYSISFCGVSKSDETKTTRENETRRLYYILKNIEDGLYITISDYLFVNQSRFATGPQTKIISEYFMLQSIVEAIKALKEGAE